MSLAEIHHPLFIIIPHSYPERPYRIFLSVVTYFTVEIPHHNYALSPFLVVLYDLIKSLIETVLFLFVGVLIRRIYLHQHNVDRSHPSAHYHNAARDWRTHHY